MSVYDIADHPDFRFRTTDIVIRIGNTEDGAPHKEDEVGRPALPLQYLSVPPGGLRVRRTLPCPLQGPSAQRPQSCSTGCFSGAHSPVLSAMRVVAGAVGAQERPGEVALSWAPGNRWGHGSEVRQILGRGGRGTRVPRLEPHPGSVQRVVLSTHGGLWPAPTSLPFSRPCLCPHPWRAAPLTPSCLPCSLRWAR